MHVPFVPHEAAPWAGHAAAQQIPSTQFPLVQAEALVQVPPLQLPAEHVVPVGQVLPQPPQLSSLICVEMHPTPGQ